MFVSEGLMNSELKIIGQEQPQPNVRFYPDIYLHCLRKNVEHINWKNGYQGRFELRIALVLYHYTNKLSYSFLRGGSTV